MVAATETSTLLLISVTEIAEVLLPVDPDTTAVCLLDAETEAVVDSVDAATATVVVCVAPKNQDVATG